MNLAANLQPGSPSQNQRLDSHGHRDLTSQTCQHPPEDDRMPANHNDLEKRLWDAADELRANSKLKSSEYSIPVLGLIFLRYSLQ